MTEDLTSTTVFEAHPTYTTAFPNLPGAGNQNYSNSWNNTSSPAAWTTITNETEGRDDRALKFMLASHLSWCFQNNLLPFHLAAMGRNHTLNVTALLILCPFKRAKLSQPDLDEYSIARNIIIWLSPILLLLGTTGNLLSIVVMRRKKLRHSTTALYLTVLALVDTSVLYSGLLSQWIFMLKGKDLNSYSDASCKLHMFSWYFFQQYQSWILVAIAVERLLAVLLPHSFHLIFTRRSSIIILIVSAFLLLCLNSHWFWTFGLSQHKTPEFGIVHRCKMSIEYKTFHKVWIWLHFFVMSAVPFVIMLISNSIIGVSLLYMRYRKFTPGNTTHRTSVMTSVLPLLSVSFFLTTGPLAIYTVLYTNLKLKFIIAGRGRGGLEIAWAALTVLMYTNNVANFLLYCLSGATFRKEFIGMFSRFRARVAPIGTVDTGHSLTRAGTATATESTNVTATVTTARRCVYIHVLDSNAEGATAAPSEQEPNRETPADEINGDNANQVTRVEPFILEESEGVDEQAEQQASVHLTPRDPVVKSSFC